MEPCIRPTLILEAIERDAIGIDASNAAPIDLMRATVLDQLSVQDTERYLHFRLQMQEQSEALCGCLREVFEASSAELTTGDIMSALPKCAPETIDALGERLLDPAAAALVKEQIRSCNPEEAYTALAPAIVAAAGDLTRLRATIEILAADPLSLRVRSRMKGILSVVESEIQATTALFRDFERRTIPHRSIIDQSEQQGKEKRFRAPVITIPELKMGGVTEGVHTQSLDKAPSARQAVRKFTARHHINQLEDKLQILEREIQRAERAIITQPGDDYFRILHRNAEQLEFDRTKAELRNWQTELNRFDC